MNDFTTNWDEKEVEDILYSGHREYEPFPWKTNKT